MTGDEVAKRYSSSPPIVRAAIDAILLHEDRIDPMGYDMQYYQDDLPSVVSRAIEAWDEFRN